jgi:hypothetical protein
MRASSCPGVLDRHRRAIGNGLGETKIRFGVAASRFGGNERNRAHHSVSRAQRHDHVGRHPELANRGESLGIIHRLDDHLVGQMREPL